MFGPAAKIQYDYFHLIPNARRHLWKWAVAHRRQVNQRTEEVSTPWYKKKLQVLAQSLGEDRDLLFKADERLRAEEKERLEQIVEADAKGGRRRAFLGGGWRIFENSQDEQAARASLAAWKRLPVDRQKPEQVQKVVQFLEEHFVWMTTFLRHQEVKRNSLAESGMRVLRRWEVEHDGFRSEKGRENCLRIYQAVKYLGWTVHRSP